MIKLFNKYLAAFMGLFESKPIESLEDGYRNHPEVKEVVTRITNTSICLEVDQIINNAIKKSIGHPYDKSKLSLKDELDGYRWKPVKDIPDYIPSQGENADRITKAIKALENYKEENVTTVKSTKEAAEFLSRLKQKDHDINMSINQLSSLYDVPRYRIEELMKEALSIYCSRRFAAEAVVKALKFFADNPITITDAFELQHMVDYEIDKLNK